MDVPRRIARERVPIMGIDLIPYVLVILSGKKRLIKLNLSEAHVCLPHEPAQRGLSFWRDVISCLQDKIGPQKVRMPSRHNILDDVAAFRIRLGRD